MCVRGNCCPTAEPLTGCSVSRWIRERAQNKVVLRPRVLKIRIGRAQSFSLELEGGILIECFPTASCGDDSVEAWRLFRPIRQEPPFVVGPHGFGLDT